MNQAMLAIAVFAGVLVFLFLAVLIERKTMKKLAQSRLFNSMRRIFPNGYYPPMMPDRDGNGPYDPKTGLTQAEIRKIQSAATAKYDGLLRLIPILNWITTVIFLIPMIVAGINILRANPTSALNFDFIGLVTLIVTKGGLFLLSVLLLAVKGIPGGVGGAIGAEAYNRMRRRGSKSRERSRVD